jgi:hypothetical protein
MSRPSQAYLNMIVQKLDALNAVNGGSPKGGRGGSDEFGQMDHYAQYKIPDHFDQMGQTAMAYLERKRQNDQNGGHGPMLCS